MNRRTALWAAALAFAPALNASPAPAGVRFVDVNDDRRPDRVTFGADHSIQVALNRGRRHFEEVVQPLPDAVVASALPTDLNGDGRVDLYVVAQGANIALIGDGSGRFLDQTRELGLDDQGYGVDAEQQDLDGDGHLDLLLHNLSGDVVFWATGTGTFERAADTPKVDPKSTATSTLASLLGVIGGRTGAPTGVDDNVEVEIGVQPDGEIRYRLRPLTDEARGTRGERSPLPGAKDLSGNRRDIARDDGRGGDIQTSQSGEELAPKWTVAGNTGTIPGLDFMGTTDMRDLVIKTAGIQRMRVQSTGELRVEGDTDIDATLDVTEKTHIFDPSESRGTADGALVVDGGTGIGKRLTVGGDGVFESSVDIAENLAVHGVATLNNLTVEKDAAIGEDLTVGIDATIGNDLVVMNNAAIGNDLGVTRDLTVSNNAHLLQAATVGTDLSIGNDLGVGNDANISNDLGVNHDLTVMNNATIAKDLDVTQTLEVGSDATISGALTVTGPLKGNTNLHVVGGGGLGPNSEHVAYFENSSGGNTDGLAIRINQPITSSANSFLTFYNGNGEITGRVRGFNLNNPGAPIDLFGIQDIPIPAFTDLISLGGFFNPGSLPSLSIDFILSGFDFSSGFLPTITNPLLAFGPTSNLEVVMEPLICWALDNGFENLITTNPFDIAVAGKIIIAQQKCLDKGVTYGSGGADYAEWMEKRNPVETFSMGQVVGVHGGKITKDTRGAEQVLVVSFNPAVLGNMPDEGDEDRFEKIAFMGQVSVLVRGSANPGDYILPSGKSDGFAIAVPASEIRLDQVGDVIGRAQSAAPDRSMGMVDVRVGLKSNEWAPILNSHAERISRLEELVGQLSDSESIDALALTNQN